MSAPSIITIYCIKWFEMHWLYQVWKVCAFDYCAETKTESWAETQNTRSCIKKQAENAWSSCKIGREVVFWCRAYCRLRASLQIILSRLAFEPWRTTKIKFKEMYSAFQ